MEEYAVDDLCLSLLRDNDLMLMFKMLPRAYFQLSCYDFLSIHYPDVPVSVCKLVVYRVCVSLGR